VCGREADEAEEPPRDPAAAGQDVAGELKDSARTALDDVKDTAAEAKQAVTDTAHDKVAETKDSARSAADSVRDATDAER